MCHKIALENSCECLAQPVWLAQHEPAGRVPQPGLALQDQDGQETSVFI